VLVYNQRLWASDVTTVKLIMENKQVFIRYLYENRCIPSKILIYLMWRMSASTSFMLTAKIQYLILKYLGNEWNKASEIHKNDQ